MNARGIAAAIAAAIVITGTAAGVAAAGTSAPQHKAPVCKIDGVLSPDTRHVIPAGKSLYGWAQRHADGVANVLSGTIECGPGIQQLAMLNYLDNGSGAVGKPAPKGGLIVWTPYYVK